MLTTALCAPQEDIDIARSIAEFLHTEAASKLDEMEQHQLLLHLSDPKCYPVHSNVKEVVNDFREWLTE
ncbi:hypothetical protein NVP1031O_134 [Vibrio phage 1.031.O._10N.261.46.F8]|nr:hypothetical protein NVP1031O_134 [Vibrio phage 1.031.O._10N.261.46.F8]